ncbi:MAG: hypothetical protein QM752_07185 [Gammaproteobacteria bacterium]
MIEKEKDRRGNVIEHTHKESKWAVSALKNLPEELANLFKGYVSSSAQEYKFRSPLPAQNASIIEWMQFQMDETNNVKTDFEKGFGESISPSEQQSIWAVRNRSFFKHRGRVEAESDEIKSESFKNTYAGIMERSSPHDDEFKDFWSRDLLHAKSSNISVSSKLSTATVLRKSGAPFIAGASGSIQYFILDLQRGLDDDRNYKQKDFEKLILVFAAGLVAAGHHSLSECILPAKAAGFFSDVADPRTNYEKFLKDISKHCKKYDLPILCQETELLDDKSHEPPPSPPIDEKQTHKKMEKEIPQEIIEENDCSKKIMKFTASLISMASVGGLTITGIDSIFVAQHDKSFFISD